ncbi:hypothetical protein OHT76_44095 [Streptomyces sp. NBC_00287]|uniref:hypothetical protein n=1 Tax=Streptomyces sp. NBC_00287 TaxID=2975702 RepID=UPI002E28CB83|nr:hypothetical protein [Streptomyces sp. NBC_00287]
MSAEQTARAEKTSSPARNLVRASSQRGTHRPMAQPFYDLSEQFPHHVFEITEAAVEALGDQWGCYPGHWG